MTEHTPPERVHVVEEKPVYSAAPRPVPQATSPVGPGVDCPVTVAEHMLCVPTTRGLDCVPAGEQTNVTVVDWAVASRAGSKASTNEEPLRSKAITKTNDRTFLCLGSTMPRLCSAYLGMT